MTLFPFSKRQQMHCIAVCLLLLSQLTTEAAPLLSDTLGWSASRNAAELYRNISLEGGSAALFYRMLQGELLNFNESAKENAYGMEGQSYFRLSPTTLVYGAASYQAEISQAVAGSAFLPRENRAFDLLLLDEENLGKRLTEWYKLEGAVSHQLHSKISVGMRLNYQAANQTRTRDLRYTNNALDLVFSPGAAYQLTKNVRIGMHYAYLRYVEEIFFKTYGTTDQTYTTLIDFGGFYGKKELFGTTGYTNSNEKNPYVETAHELGVQLSWTNFCRWALFYELNGSWGNGYFGKNSSASVVFMEHEINHRNHRLEVHYQGKQMSHQLELQFRQTTLSNYENAWRMETSSTGSSVIEYYGQNQVGKRHQVKMQAHYRASLPSTQHQRWEGFLHTKYEKREVEGILYPYYRRQALQLWSQEGGLSYQRSIHKLSWQLQGGLAYAFGSGNPYEDNLLGDSSAEGTLPTSAEGYLMQQHRYLTNARITPKLGIKLMVPLGKMQYYTNLSQQVELPLTSEPRGNRYFLHASIGVLF